MAAFYGEQATLREAGTTVDASMSGGLVRAVIDEHVTAGTEIIGDGIYIGGIHLPPASTVVDAWLSNDVFGSHVVTGIRVFSSGSTDYVTESINGATAGVHRFSDGQLPLEVSGLSGDVGDDGELMIEYLSGTVPTAGASIVGCVFYVTGA